MDIITVEWPQFDSEKNQATVNVVFKNKVLAEYHFDFKNPENDYVKSELSSFFESIGKPFPQGEEAFIAVQKHIAEVQLGLKELNN